MQNLLVVDVYEALWSLVYKFASEHWDSDGELTLFPDFPGVPMHLQDICYNISRSSSLHTIQRSSIKWLFPLQAEFYLCSAGLLLNFWFHAQEPNVAGEHDGQVSLEMTTTADTSTLLDYTPRFQRQQTRTRIRIFCGGSIVSFILGACVSVCFFVLVLIQGLVDLGDCKDSVDGKAYPNATSDISTKDAMAWHNSQWIGFRLITITTCTAILLDLLCCHEQRREGHFGIDNLVLGVFLPAVVVYHILRLVAAAYLQPTECTPLIHGQLTITISFMAVADALLQVGIVFCGSHFACHQPSSRCQRQDEEKVALVGNRKPFCIARHLLAFLAMCDLAVWLIRSLEAINKQMDTVTAPCQYFGKATWSHIANALYPILALFYFHCFACLLELHLLLRLKAKTA